MRRVASGLNLPGILTAPAWLASQVVLDGGWHVSVIISETLGQIEVWRQTRCSRWVVAIRGAGRQDDGATGRATEGVGTGTSMLGLAAPEHCCNEHLFLVLMLLTKSCRWASRRPASNSVARTSASRMPVKTLCRPRMKGGIMRRPGGEPSLSWQSGSSVCELECQHLLISSCQPRMHMRPLSSAGYSCVPCPATACDSQSSHEQSFHLSLWA